MTTNLDQFAASVLRTRQLLAHASEAQWQAGMTPTPREDTTERAKGMVGDPTPSIVADGRRQHLRETYVKANKALDTAFRQMQAIEDQLAKALNDWQG